MIDLLYDCQGAVKSNQRVSFPPQRPLALLPVCLPHISFQRRQGQTLVEAGLLNVDVLQSRRKKLRFGRSSVHAWGVFADEPIAAGDLVIEYR